VQQSGPPIGGPRRFQAPSRGSGKTPEGASDLLAAAAIAARRSAAWSLLQATAAAVAVPAVAAALALLRTAAAGGVGSLLAQLLQAHLQAHALEVAPGHRAAAAVAAPQLLALATTLLQPAHRRPLRAFAAIAPAALLARTAPFAAPVVALAGFAAQLLAALLQAFAHRLEALFGLLQPFAGFGALGLLPVRALRLRAFLGGGEREEQSEHEQ